MFARIAPRKARLVIDMIRGRNCAEALEQLQFNGRRSACLIRDVLRSVMASAEEGEAEMRHLFISDQGSRARSSDRQADEPHQDYGGGGLVFQGTVQSFSRFWE